MAGVIRIQPDMMQAGHSWFPVPYVLLLRDLAGLNAGRMLPRIPRTAVEAAVRMAGERHDRPGTITEASHDQLGTRAWRRRGPFSGPGRSAA